MMQDSINHSINKGAIVEISTIQNKYIGVVINNTATTVKLLHTLKNYRYYIFIVPKLSIVKVEEIGFLKKAGAKANLSYLYKQIEFHKALYNKSVAIIHKHTNTKNN